MKHFLQKSKLIICGAGGKGGGGGSQPPPPNVSQYPAVLAPPQFSNLETISSFSYAEMIDLLSDGPIEGLINKNGKKVYDENIFEGIYLNDTAIKETSSVSSDSVDITFLKESFKSHLLINNSRFKTTETYSRKTTFLASSIDNRNFNSDILIESFRPEYSIIEFVKSLNGSFDSVPLIEKTFASSPVLSEELFLTIITIPKFIAFINKDKFDTTEGGADGSFPIRLDISNLSDYIYFSISSENLNSFNYFELPRSFVLNNLVTSAGKKTIRKNLLSTTDFLKYEFLNTKIYIWSLYNKDLGFKKIDNILDKYFNKIFVNQNSPSLFNYNLIQSEFKNGMEYQAPLQYFNSIQIDTEYNKELIGPYKISGSYNPTNAFGIGGVQRVTSYKVTNQYTLPSTNTTLENETSDDIRYVKSWPIEYDCKNAPYLICNAILNYSQFDKVSSSRVSQEAIPITHYIENENVEEAFVTLNINQLFDTNHIDLITDNSKYVTSYQQSKIGQTDFSPDGLNQYSQIIGYTNSIGYTSGNLYLLVYGSNYNDGYVIDGFKTTGTVTSNFESGIICNLTRLNPSAIDTLYYKANDISAGLAKCIANVGELIGNKLYNASEENCLVYFQIPNDSYSIRESFNIKDYSISTLESKLKLTTDTNNSFYYFGLDQKEQLLSLGSYSPSTALNSILNSFTVNGANKFFIAKSAYRTASSSELTTRYIVGHIINGYLNWDYNGGIPDIDFLGKNQYLNIKKYIWEPYRYLNQARYGDDQSLWSRSIIGNIYLIGINGDYLRTNYLKDSVYLSLDFLDQLLEEYALKTDDSTNFNFSLKLDSLPISNFSTLKVFENTISNFLNGKLIGSSSIFNLKPYSLSQYVVPTVSNAFKLTVDDKSQYISNNIFLIDSSKFSIDPIQDIFIGNDVIFEYNLYTNVSQNSILTPTSKVQYVDMDTSNEGNQAKNASSSFVTQGGNVVQQLTAGTRIPAIVTIDVEVGYETREKEVYIGPSEFFCYRYSIYGMSTDQALIDVGRKSHKYLVACKLTSDRGGYLSQYKNIYQTTSLYLIKFICRNYAVTPATENSQYYLTSNKNTFNIGNMSNSSYEESETLSISEYFESEIPVGLKQQYIREDDLATQYFSSISSSNANLNISNEVGNYFFNQNKTLNTASAMSFLRTKGLISNKKSSLSSQHYSKSICSLNINNYDRFIFADQLNRKCLQTDIYNFDIDLYERIFTPSAELAGSGENQNFYASLVKITYSSIVNLQTIYGYYEIGPNIDEINLEIALANKYFFVKKYNNDTFIFHISKDNFDLNTFKTQLQNDILSIIKLKSTGVVSSRTADLNINYGSDRYPTKDNSFLANLNLFLENKKYFVWNEEVTDNLEINSNNFDKAIYPFTSLIKNFDSVSNIEWKWNEKQFSATYLTYESGDVAYDDYGNPLVDTSYPFGEVENNYSYNLQINISEKFQIQATDKRNNLDNAKAAFNTVRAKLWTIYDYNNKRLSLIANASSIADNYQNLGLELNYLNLDKILDSYIGTRFICVREQGTRGAWNYGFTTYFDHTTGPNDKYYETWQDEKRIYNCCYLMAFWDTSGRGRIPATNLGVDKNTNIALWLTDPIISYLGYMFGSCARTYIISDSKSYIQGGTQYNTKYNNFNYGDKINGLVCHVSDCCYFAVNRGQGVTIPSWAKTIRGFEYYRNIRPSYSFQNFNPELNTTRSTCLITVPALDLTKDSSPLACVEKLLLDNSLIGGDFRIINSYETSPIYKRDYADSRLFFRYYELDISNASSYQLNTLSNDAGLTIQIPKSRKDQDGNILRRYIKIIKKSHETLSPLISKKVSLQKVTEIIPQKFSYPFSAIVGTKIDSRAFSQIPVRTFHCKLKKVLIPSNYFIYDENEEDVRYKKGSGEYRIYDEDWDGTFKLGWSNNPAWIMLDLLVNKRYGLGNYIESEQVDIWELYKISRWCDGVDDQGYYYGVSDLYGGVEPRHSFNALITDKFNVFDLINQVASVFRGHVYYLNSLITFDDDRIKPIIGEFNNLDVKDGIFSYTNHKKDDEYTAADVAYIDAKDNYKPKIEYVEDQDGIRQRGILKKQINAFGVTSKAQARRFGQYFLYQTSKENSNVTFTTDNRALLYRPGDLIRINDELMSSCKNYGKVLNIKDAISGCFSVVIDQNINDYKNYDLNSITLYSPIAKPKYEDFYSSSQYVPEVVNLRINSIFGLGAFVELKSGTVNNYNGFYRKLISGGSRFTDLKFNLIPYDTSSSIKAFSGALSVDYAIEQLTGIDGSPYLACNALYNISETGLTGTWEGNTGFINWATQAALQEDKFSIKEDLTGYLCYVENADIKNNPSKYGHWEFKIGNEPIPNFKYKLDVTDVNIKYQLPYKHYFFNNFNTGKLLALSGFDEFGGPSYIEAINFPMPRSTSNYFRLNYGLVDCYNQKHLIKTVSNGYFSLYGPHAKYDFYTGICKSYSPACRYRYDYLVNNYLVLDVCVSGYKSPSISYQDIIENSKPLIDSFNVLSYTGIEVGGYDYPLVCLTLDKYNEQGEIKKSVAVDLNCLVVNSPYSLSIKNYCEKVYKVMSITENYINEYNILGTEFNFDKFKEIEDNYEVDDLRQTFNALTAHSEAQRIAGLDRLKAPIILYLNYFSKDGVNYLLVKWDNTQNATSYLIYLQTPSQQTSNFIIEATLADFKTSENCFVKIIPIGSEVGTYTISIQSKKMADEDFFLSPSAKRSINFFTY
jgi:hypothetical protein